jgi:DNA-binding MarR family transcriptional regulator
MTNRNATAKRKAAPVPADEQQTVWEPENDLLRHLMLTAILRNNPIPIAYRLNYVANFYVGPLVKRMEETHRMTRPEWIVLFCLNQQAGLNAQQISNVTGRHKTSISTAVRQLQTKKLIVRTTDVKDGRRQVLRVTEAGQKIYKSILSKFVARESDMVACLDRAEQSALVAILDKMIGNSASWAKPY